MRQNYVPPPLPITHGSIHSGAHIPMQHRASPTYAPPMTTDKIQRTQPIVKPPVAVAAEPARVIPPRLSGRRSDLEASAPKLVAGYNPEWKEGQRVPEDMQALKLRSQAAFHIGRRSKSDGKTLSPSGIGAGQVRSFAMPDCTEEPVTVVCYDRTKGRWKCQRKNGWFIYAMARELAVI